MSREKSKSHSLADTSDSLVALDVNGLQILFDQKTNRVIKLNKTGSIIWNILISETSWIDVIHQVQHQLGCQYAQASKVALEFALRLQREGWLLLDEKRISASTQINMDTSMD